LRLHEIEKPLRSIDDDHSGRIDRPVVDRLPAEIIRQPRVGGAAVNAGLKLLRVDGQAGAPRRCGRLDDSFPGAAVWRRAWFAASKDERRYPDDEK
jgi:hypothetical protein